MTQEIGEPIRTKYTSCPSCGVFKVKDGWNYGEQICVCGFGKRPTEYEIENEQYLTAQVHNMLIDLIRLEQERDRLKEELGLCHRIIKHGTQSPEELAYVYDIPPEAELAGEGE